MARDSSSGGISGREGRDEAGTRAAGMPGTEAGHFAGPPVLLTCLFTLHPQGSQMDKIQDTIPICPTQISMVMALGAVRAGREWVVRPCSRPLACPHGMLSSSPPDVCGAPVAAPTQPFLPIAI